MTRDHLGFLKGRNMQSDRRTRAALVSLAISALLVVDLQTAAAQQTEPEEIVVTARRRSEAQQDVPIAITAFGQQEIDLAGIEQPQDFVNLTPNVTLVETQNQGTSFLTMRGISQARNSEPSAAIIVDGVLLTNPAQLTQELFDVQQIEVLKGPQGAVYGRNAIGGAIVITTKQPGDEFEGKFSLGYDDGPGYRVRAMGGGPLAGSDTFKYQAGISYYDTDGWIPNTYLNEDADPYKDTSARARLIWEPNGRLTTDARLYYSKVNTQSLYFVIDYGGDANNTSIPVRVNNRGINDRELGQLSFKLDYDTDIGTLTSITSWDSIEEILTGDNFDFKPIQESLFYNIGIPGTTLFDDIAQSQYLNVDTFSQEVRFTSNDDQRLRWIAGTYLVSTNRYISTGNIVDRGEGAFPVYRTPRGAYPTDNSVYTNSFQLTFLADGQDNFAWALFGELGYDINDKTELSFALRYDQDERKNTTLTPDPYFTYANLPGAAYGQVRKKTWSETQPRLTLRFEPSDNLTLYGSWGRGFRSGGFNQTGVGADATAQALGVRDLFDKEVADTLEFGLKSQLADHRVALNFDIFDTDAEGSYFFLFLATSSTQNLGSLGKVHYQGYEFDVTAHPTDNLDLMLGYGFTDSEIKKSVVPTDIGNQAPLVTRNTVNLTTQYHVPFGGNGREFIIRGDYQRLGDTWWDPANTTVRDPVNLLDLRLGVQTDTWSVMAWGKNVNDVPYNTEFSPGGFLWKAKPARYGVDFSKYF